MDQQSPLPAIAAHDVQVVDGLLRVAVSGDIDMSVEHLVPEWISEAIRTYPHHPVLVDLHRLRFMDSSGIRALFQARAIARTQGVTLTIDGAHGAVRAVLELTGSYEILTTSPDDDPHQALETG